MEEINIMTKDQETINLSEYMKTSPTPSYPDIKFKIDITNHVIDMKEIGLYFKLDFMLNIEIRLEDKSAYCSRPLYQSLVNQKGVKIVVPEADHHSKFYVNIEQDIFDEDDDTKHCHNYPNKNYENYEDCEKKFMKDSLHALGLKNFTPFWATNDISLVTENLVIELKKTSRSKLGSIFSGVSSSDCLKPCSKTSSTISFVSDAAINGSRAVSIVFPEDVTVEKTELIRLNIPTSLAFLGSNMGLWLGFGILQIIEIFCGAFKNFLSKVRENKTLLTNL